MDTSVWLTCGVKVLMGQEVDWIEVELLWRSLTPLWFQPRPCASLVQQLGDPGL